MFLFVLAVPKIRKYQGNPVTRKLTLGNNVTFHCDVEAGRPKPEITWYFGWTDKAKRVDPAYDARFSYPSDETWSITGIETKDRGKYRCIAKNKVGEDDLRFEITQVDGKLLHEKLNYVMLCACMKYTIKLYEHLILLAATFKVKMTVL